MSNFIKQSKLEAIRFDRVLVRSLTTASEILSSIGCLCLY